MATQYIQGMRYRFTRQGLLYEATFDGYNNGPNGESDKHVRWANVLLLMPLSAVPPSSAKRVPRSNTRNSDIT